MFAADGGKVLDAALDVIGLIALKGKVVTADARACFGKVKRDHPAARVEETGHRRKETRIGMVVSAKGLAEHHECPGLKAFGRIKGTREIDGRATSETRFFALSRMPTPEVLLETVRAHWAIENALHPLSGM